MSADQQAQQIVEPTWHPTSSGMVGVVASLEVQAKYRRAAATGAVTRV